MRKEKARSSPSRKNRLGYVQPHTRSTLRDETIVQKNRKTCQNRQCLSRQKNTKHRKKTHAGQAPRSSAVVLDLAVWRVGTHYRELCVAETIEQMIKRGRKSKEIESTARPWHCAGEDVLFEGAISCGRIRFPRIRKCHIPHVLLSYFLESA